MRRHQEMAEQEHRRQRQATYARFFPMDEAALGVLHGATLEGFEHREGAKGALEAAEEFARSLPSPTPCGLLLTGPTGVGKSHLAAAIARRAAENGFLVAWTSPTWLRQLSYLEDSGERDRLLRLAERADLLVLDDLGSDRLTEARYGYLFGLIDARWRGRRATIITSNLSMKDGSLPAALSRAEDGADLSSDRLISRLLDMCVIERHIQAGDYRIEQAKNRLKLLKGGRSS